MGELVLAACADEQGILATDLRSGALVATFEESTAQRNAFGTIGGCSGHIFACNTKKALWHVWAWGSRKPSYRASLPERMTAMAFSRDGSLCFGGAASGKIYVWQMGTGSLLRCWPAHFLEVTQLLVSEDGSFLISGSADASVRAYNIADVFAEHGAPEPFHSWSGHALAVTSLALLPGSGLQQQVVSASVDRSVRIWDIGTGRPIASRTFSSPVHSLCATPTGSEIICACGNGEIRSFSPWCGPNESGIFTGHTGAVISCAASMDGSRIASCSEVDRVRIWETRTRQCVSQVHTSRNVQVNSVAVVQRSPHAPAMPPFQPFQKLLAAPEDVPPVPLSVHGRTVALKEAMAPHASGRNFVERMLWSTAASGGGSGGGATGDSRETQELLQEAQAGQARWASVAAELYNVISEAGLDQPTPLAATVPGSQHIAVAAAAAITLEKPAAPGADGSSSTAVVAEPPVGKKKRRRQR